MTISEQVRVSGRFQKAIRIDMDLKDVESLKGFICPRSSADVLRTVANHISKTQQCAFTWTGPYGSGKSSLAIAMSALLDGDLEKRELAAKSIGNDTASVVWKALPPRKNGWRVLPVVGRRDDPTAVIGEALENFSMTKRRTDKKWSEKKIVDTLSNLATQNPDESGGIIVFLDEMGKFLEAAALNGYDIYLFQQLAEASARSNGRLILIGMLHQSFEEYAHRLSREMRDEWSKIQGRFVDLAINIAGEEQIDLLSRAIETNRKFVEPSLRSKEVAYCVQGQRPSLSKHFAQSLEECWPLHPIVAALLGPISRRRFGQNQRSLFGFLNSAEPLGFQDFIRYKNEQEFYQPYNLWDYLRINLEPSILASPDGHRWAMAAEAVDRCESMGGTEIDINILKTIALIDMFRERSGLLPTSRLLKTIFPDEDINPSLEQLINWSLIIFRKHLNGYAIFAGSDFNIEEAIDTALEEINSIDFKVLKDIAGLQPILAKRHYHKKGALRWFDVDISPLSQVLEIIEQYDGDDGTIGKFLLAIPTLNEESNKAEKICRETSRKANKWDIIIGLSPRAWTITDLARELIAIERVRNESPELRGDAVARREVQARLAALQGQLENEIRNAFNNASWYLKFKSSKKLSQTDLNVLASKTADKRFISSPKIFNELLNRAKPSKTAIAAQNSLMRRMVNNEGHPRFKIDGYPAERGLFDSLLYNTALYKQTSQSFKFVPPDEENDPCDLAPLWKVATDFLIENSHRTVSLREIYNLWRNPPYGVKDGLLPILSLAFILSRKVKLAFYREGIFQAHFSDLDVDYLIKDSKSIQLRWMDLSNLSRLLLSDMAGVVRELNKGNELVELEPIDVARGLIEIYDRLPSWTKRTLKLSSNASKIRNIFKKANDPNKLLFDDLPSMFGEHVDFFKEKDVKRVVSYVREGLIELIEVYPTMLKRLKTNLLSELQVPNNSIQAIVELRERAENIKQIAGDFRLNAFISRLTVFEGTDQDIEGIIGLATNKPARNLVDPDFDQAAIEITDMAQKFIRVEAFARIKGRNNKRHSIAAIIGSGENQNPVMHEFDIADSDYKTIDEIMNRIEKEIQSIKINNPNIVLGALSKLIVRYGESIELSKKSHDT